MRFVPTAIDGAYFLETVRATDARGAFQRAYCRTLFREAGVPFEPAQCSLSVNPVMGTLRGLHYQRPPHAEAKLIFCVAGSVFDVAVDLRRSSPSFGASVSTKLSASGSQLFYIPAGCAHGFLTLEPDTSLFYFIDTPFEAGAGDGVRWNDRAFGIEWPAVPQLMSDRDAGYSDFDPAVAGVP